jgi:DNA-binding LacI/PurR family transcriptional regulator
LRQNAFITRVAELGMMLTTRINGGEYGYYHARHGAALQIAAKGGTDAIFFANDILAIGGIDALRERVV